MVTVKSPGCFAGLSTDAKPTFTADQLTGGINATAINALFLELDTGDFYFYDGTAWAKVGGAA